ncbi:TIGR01777 family oxidoreductase [Rugosimonospora acidiphila]|uniref:TIGR01777 family oxidoreductase n=1 Tax=Rugosimonospora acidiphila TaxID=556531 RepID=A0ABP9RS44_9ACTN
MRIIIGGASGFIGKPLVKRLGESGHDVVRLVRREPNGPTEVGWRPNQGELDPGVLDGADAVINLAGVGVGDQRWNDQFKKLLRSSRINATSTIAKAVAAARVPPRVLINASAVGYYGDTGDDEVEESAPPGSSFLARLCVSWEAATAPAQDAGVRVVCLRSGVILGPGGGYLKPMMPLFRIGLGGRLGSGRQWIPWVSLVDELSAIEFLLRTEVAGAVNLTGVAPVRNAEFTRTLARVLGRPALLPVPAPVLRVAAGEFANEAVASQRVLPGALRAAEFRYEHRDLETALRWVVGK